MSPYRIAVNMEWTSKCNARCAMCPQHAIERPALMTQPTFDRVLQRLDDARVFRVVVAGYGEPTTHPRFMRFVSAVGEHPARFDMATNGQALDAARLQHVDGKLGLMLVSFSSIDPNVYGRVHRNLDHERVKRNIRTAARVLRKTALGVSLTPMAECLDTLPDTIGWLRDQGVELLTMSPTLYDRAGSMTEHRLASQRLRETIARYGLHSQELDFIPSFGESLAQIRRNRFRCVARNSDLLISAQGDYLYCFNDPSHAHRIGHVSENGIDEVLRARERMGPVDAICDGCSMRDRYGPGELAGVAGRYLRGRARLALAG